MPEVLGIIPARSGSVRVPGKNLRTIKGKPIVQYALEAALNSHLLNAIALSSDSDEILNCGLKVNEKIIAIKRPAMLATENSPAIDYVKHALNYLSENKHLRFDCIAIIQPSSPLTTGTDIDSTIQLMFDYEAECAVSIREVPYDFHPSKYLLLKNNKLNPFITPSQSEMMLKTDQKFYVRNGSVYVTSKQLIEEGKLLSDNCAAYIMPAARSVDINEEMDLLFAEFLLNKV